MFESIVCCYNKTHEVGTEVHLVHDIHWHCASIFMQIPLDESDSREAERLCERDEAYVVSSVYKNLHLQE